MFLPKAFISLLASLLQIGSNHYKHSVEPGWLYEQLGQLGQLDTLDYHHDGWNNHVILNPSYPQEVMLNIIAILQYVRLGLALLFFNELHQCVCNVEVRVKEDQSLMKKLVLAFVIPMAIIGVQYLVGYTIRFNNAALPSWARAILLVFSGDTPIKVLLHAIFTTYTTYMAFKIVKSLKKAQHFRGQNSSSNSNAKTTRLVGLVIVAAFSHIMQMFFLIVVVTLTTFGMHNANTMQADMDCVSILSHEKGTLECFFQNLDWDAFTHVGLTYCGLVEFLFFLCPCYSIFTRN